MRETSSLKLLSFNTLERLKRNKARNKSETNRLNLVSHPIPRETKSISVLCASLDPVGEIPKSETWFNLKDFICESYQERLAIAEYDGKQSPLQAQRIAYQDALIAVLNTLPHTEGEEDWLDKRINTAKSWLGNQGIVEPE